MPRELIEISVARRPLVPAHVHVPTQRVHHLRLGRLVATVSVTTRQCGRSGRSAATSCRI
jgi:hypothetical protein